MSYDQPVAGYDIASGAQRGARFTLYDNRLVLAGADAVETVPLAHLASVRVAFERDARKLHWAIGLLFVALVLGSLSGPLASWMQALQAKVSSNASGESLEAVLLASFSAIGHLARLLVPVAWILTLIAAALLALFWIGHTTLTLAFAATERACAVRGRNRQLMDFADLLAERLAERKG
jgi:hypothetical protein